MLSVMGAFAEFERALIRERQREGIALTKQRGAYRGRKKALSPERVAELRRRIAAGAQKAKLAREFGIVPVALSGQGLLLLPDAIVPAFLLQWIGRQPRTGLSELINLRPEQSARADFRIGPTFE